MFNISCRTLVFITLLHMSMEIKSLQNDWTLLNNGLFFRYLYIDLVGERCVRF